MSVFAWIILGLIAGYIGSKIVNKQGEGLILDLVLGIVGAMAGGWLFNMFGASGVTGLNLYSVLVAVIEQPSLSSWFISCDSTIVDRQSVLPTSESQLQFRQPQSMEFLM